MIVVRTPAIAADPRIFASLFTYTISDGQGGAATGIVSVTISPSRTPAQGYFPPSLPC